MPHPSSSVWDHHIEDCAVCTSPDRDEPALLRCAVLTVLQHGVFMVEDDIPLAEILSDGSHYLRDLASSLGGDETTPVPKAEQWPWVDAELRLAVGLDAVSTLDARIDGVLATAARRTPRRQADLLARAAEQFAQQHAPASRTP
ncbi:hypothetical protein [Streptomyces sp. NPDC002324]